MTKARPRNGQRRCLGAFLRNLLAEVQQIRSYNDCCAKLRGAEPPSDWQEKYWQLPSGSGLRYLRQQLNAIVQPFNATASAERILHGDMVSEMIESARAEGLPLDFNEGKAPETARRYLMDTYEWALESLVVRLIPRRCHDKPFQIGCRWRQ